MIKKNRLLFSGELPPKSVHGISYSNAINLSFLENLHDIFIVEEIVDLKQHGNFNSYKLFSLFSRFLQIILHSIKFKFKYFYLIYSNSLLGELKTLTILVLFRLFNLKSIIVVHIHRGDVEKVVEQGWLNKLLFSYILALSNKLIVLSEKTKKYIIDNFKYPNSVYVLENTVFNEISYQAKDFNSKTINCLFISNYIEEKGILKLLEAFSQLSEDFKLSCYGNFTDEILKEKILSYQSNNILINGPIYNENKFLEIYNSDVLILPSFNEGKPIVLLEAMMIGTPIIASDVGYVREMFYENYPFLFQNITSESIIDMINKYSMTSTLEKINISNSLLHNYATKYSNEIHRSNLLNIFND